MNNDHFQALFDELRSLKQRTIQTWQLQSLWKKLCASYEMDAHQHTDQIVPYLRDWPIFKQEPLTTVRDIKSLAKAIQVAPFATFTFSQSRKRLGDARCIALLQAPEFTHVSQLDLEWCELSVLAIEHLLESPHLTHLKNLNLTRNNVGRDGAMCLANTTSLTHLETLYIYEGKLDDRCAEIFAHATGLPELKTLKLPHNAIGDPGAYALAGMTGLPKLKTLDLYENDITVDGARALVANTKFQYLYLFDNAMDDEEGEHIELMAAPNQQVICVIDQS